MASANKYQINLRNGENKQHSAENVHVTAQGNVKLLNGHGPQAQLVAFYNAADVISVEKIDG